MEWGWRGTAHCIPLCIINVKINALPPAAQDAVTCRGHYHDDSGRKSKSERSARSPLSPPPVIRPVIADVMPLEIVVPASFYPDALFKQQRVCSSQPASTLCISKAVGQEQRLSKLQHP